MADPIASALIGSIINAIVDSVAAVPPPVVPTPIGLVRALPAEAKRGWMQPPGLGEVVIDGKTQRLSPATQIRNGENMIVMPGMIRERVMVKYTLDPMGAVQRIWILTPAEVAAVDVVRGRMAVTGTPTGLGPWLQD